MTTTTYYNLNIVEGTDIVNPLTVDNPNYQKIDETMHDNAVAGVTLATELTNATIHALTRENSDCSVIRFIATSRWKAGDSVTVDGVPVLALLPSGETLPDGAYVINANVLCVLTGTNLTVYVSKSSANASDITYNDTNVEEELNALNGSVATINSEVSKLTSDVSTLTNDVSTLTSDLSNLNGIGSATLLAETQTSDSSNTITLSGDKLSNYRFLYLVNQSAGETLNIYAANFIPVNIVNQYNGYIAAGTADKIVAVFSYISDVSFKLYITDTLYKVSLYGIK